MAVYKRGYQRYSGPITTPFAQLMVLPRFAWSRILKQRLVVVLFVVSLFWPLLCIGFIYLSNHSELWASFGPGLSQWLEIGGSFFNVFMRVQSTFAMILAAVAGPGLIAPDLANNALPLYFSRPFSRPGYIIARMIVMAGLLSLVTILPAILLLAIQTGLAGFSWLTANWTLAAGVLAGFALWIFTVSLVALACSAYVKWRVVAGALVMAFFFLLAGAAEMLNAVLRVQWASAFNPGYAMNTIWGTMLGLEPPDGPGALECGLVIAGLAAALLAILMRKLRAVEVVA